MKTIILVEMSLNVLCVWENTVLWVDLIVSRIGGGGPKTLGSLGLISFFPPYCNQ